MRIKGSSCPWIESEKKLKNILKRTKHTSETQCYIKTSCWTGMPSSKPIQLHESPPQVINEAFISNNASSFSPFQEFLPLQWPTQKRHSRTGHACGGDYRWLWVLDGLPRKTCTCSQPPSSPWVLKHPPSVQKPVWAHKHKPLKQVLPPRFLGAQTRLQTWCYTWCPVFAELQGQFLLRSLIPTKYVDKTSVQKKHSFNG